MNLFDHTSDKRFQKQLSKAGQFDENEHPRDNDGKFTSGGGSVGRDSFKGPGRGRIDRGKKFKEMITTAAIYGIPITLASLGVARLLGRGIQRRGERMRANYMNTMRSRMTPGGASKPTLRSVQIIPPNNNPPSGQRRSNRVEDLFRTAGGIWDRRRK